MYIVSIYIYYLKQTPCTYIYRYLYGDDTDRRVRDVTARQTTTRRTHRATERRIARRTV